MSYDPSMQNFNLTSLYWQGNAAKTRCITDLLCRAKGREIAVFDYGCGDGGDWPKILADNPKIRFYGYEPNKSSFQNALTRLQGVNAEIFTGDDISTLNLKVDFIVSFSVLEHVYDRRAFLLNAHRLLADNGLFYLNYDDGHFRNMIDLADPRGWFDSFKVRLHNLLATPLAAIGRVSSYQKRVISKELDALLEATGFSIEHVEYHNLQSLKEIFKEIAPDHRSDFSRLWVNIELELNTRFRSNLETTKKGDSVNLWLYMASRTLWLRPTPFGGN